MSRYKKGSKIGTATIINSSAPVCFTNVESTTRSTPLEAKKDPRFNSPVRITIISYRSRLCDADGISAKAAIDGLVHCGILADDSPEYVQEVRYLQVKVKNKSEEETRLIIEEIQTK